MDKIIKKPVNDPKRSKNIAVPKRVPGETSEARQRREMLEEALVRACIAEGLTRDEMSIMLDISQQEVGVIENRLLATDAHREVVKTVPQRYYEYALKQDQCVRDLDGIVDFVRGEISNYLEDRKRALAEYRDDSISLKKAMPVSPPTGVAVLAIKAKSTIFDQTIKTGQELGIIPKRAKEVRVSGSINLAALPTDSLKSMLEKKLNEMNVLVTQGTIPQTFVKMMEKIGNATTGISGGISDDGGSEYSDSPRELVGRTEPMDGEEE